MTKIKQLYLESQNKITSDILSLMGFDASKTFIRLSFQTKPCTYKKINNLQGESTVVIDHYYVKISGENFYIGQNGILELENITVSSLTGDSTLPYLNIMYEYEI